VLGNLFAQPLPCPLWSTSWSGALHLIFHTFLHPISVFISKHMPLMSNQLCSSVTESHRCGQRRILVVPSVQRRKVWLTPTTRMPCSNAAKTPNPLKFAGVPQTNETISATSGPSSPYYGYMWRRHCCLTSFFSDCRYMPYLRKYSPKKLCDGAQMAIFGDIFASCICSEPRAAHFRPAV